MGLHVGVISAKQRLGAIDGDLFDLIDDPGEEWDLMEKRLDCIWVLRPVAARLGALAQSAARYPNIQPGQQFTGY